MKHTLAVLAILCLPALASAQQPVSDGGGSLTVDASNLDVQSGGADLATAAQITTLQGYEDGVETLLTSLETLLTSGTAANTGKVHLSAGTTEDEFEVKATAGVLAGMSAFNSDASADAWVKCTNLTAANQAPATSPIIYRMFVPHGGGAVHSNIEQTFSVALSCYIVLSTADGSVDEVGANDVAVNVQFR